MTLTHDNGENATFSANKRIIPTLYTFKLVKLKAVVEQKFYIQKRIYAYYFLESSVQLFEKRTNKAIYHYINIYSFILYHMCCDFLLSKQ